MYLLFFIYSIYIQLYFTKMYLKLHLIIYPMYLMNIIIYTILEQC